MGYRGPPPLTSLINSFSSLNRVTCLPTSLLPTTVFFFLSVLESHTSEQTDTWSVWKWPTLCEPLTSLPSGAQGLPTDRGETRSTSTVALPVTCVMPRAFALPELYHCVLHNTPQTTMTDGPGSLGQLSPQSVILYYICTLFRASKILLIHLHSVRYTLIILGVYLIFSLYSGLKKGLLISYKNNNTRTCLFLLALSLRITNLWRINVLDCDS
jgi:hypothetical protein